MNHARATALLFILASLTAPTRNTSAAPSIGCGRSLASGSYQLIDQHMRRVYRLFVPTRYRPTTPLPLILVFHGWGGDENEFLDNPSVTALAGERGYILAAPRGLGSSSPDANRNSWSFRGSTTGRATGGPICDVTHTPTFTYPSCRNVAQTSCSWTQCQSDDVAFTLALVQHLETTLCVDTSRVFATGGSNGGMFTWELGQNGLSASIFRAIAPLIGLPHRGFDDPPAGKGGLPVLLITGIADPTVPPGPWESVAFTTTRDGNAYFYTSATAMMRRWGDFEHCPYRGRSADLFNARSGPAVCRTYCGRDTRGWSASGPAWPRVLDCRAPMAHEYGLDWSWKLILDFFDAQSGP